MPIEKRFLGIATMVFLLGTSTAGHAHFGVIIPTDDIVTQDNDKKLGLDVKFIHPMEGQ